MAAGQGYQLTVIGGNPAIHNINLAIDTQGDLTIFPTSYQGQRSNATVFPGPSPSTLLAKPNSTLYYTLQGPSGKGEFKLDQSTQTTPFGIGAQIISDKWVVAGNGDRLLLRNKALPYSGHWIAEQNTNLDGDEVWFPWWLTPNGAVLEDFDTYVLIDLELQKV